MADMLKTPRQEAKKGMFSFLTRSWWVPFLGGIAAIVFGVLAIAMPAITLRTLIIAFAIFLLVQGGFLIYVGLKKYEDAKGTAITFAGVILGVVGIWTLVATDTAASLLIIIMGAWALALGLWTLISAFSIKSLTEKWWLPALGGILLVIAGILVIAQPWTGIAAIAITIGIGSISWGALLTWIGWTLRSIAPPEEPEPR
ncbi:hypothetical protein EJ997_07790 [Flaviflexus ciconiae]|uniref:HdeD family acid-resistance protein n=2 Tax=Flaviflexus ciconiae TaxID=2496867 RepID=A0A3S9PY23_9ACTO|nr:hypothetical protein EJ997_07790 [Flaviflexus ciconiae]